MVQSCSGSFLLGKRRSNRFQVTSIVCGEFFKISIFCYAQFSPISVNCWTRLSMWSESLILPTATIRSLSLS